MEEEIKIEKKIEVKKKPKGVEPSPEQLESRQRAHDIKVAKFLAGGKF